MTLIRILTLSVLLGSAIAAFVWFFWGAAANLLPRRAAAPEEPAKPAKKDAPAGPGKAA